MPVSPSRRVPADADPAQTGEETEIAASVRPARLPRPARPPYPAAAQQGDVDDIDGPLEATSPLAVVAPRRFGHTDLNILPVALRPVWKAAGARAGLAGLLGRFHALGGTMVDTSCGDPRSRQVQAAIGRLPARPDLVVTVRVGAAGRPGALGRAALRRTVEAALRRLNRDRIDVLYLEADSTPAPLVETLSAAGDLIADGLVRHLGAADVSAQRLVEARLLAAAGLPKFVALQCPYGLFERREFEAALCIVSAGQELAVCPTPPPDVGALLGGTVRSAARLPAARGFFGRRRRIHAAVQAVAAAHGAAPAAVALSWLLAKRSIVAPVVEAADEGGITAASAGVALRLTRTQVRELDAASAR